MPQRRVIRIYNRINQVSRFIQGETHVDVFICGGDCAFFFFFKSSDKNYLKVLAQKNANVVVKSS